MEPDAVVDDPEQRVADADGVIADAGPDLSGDDRSLAGKTTTLEKSSS